MRKLLIPAFSALVLATAACAGDEPQADASDVQAAVEPAATTATVAILEPTQGTEVQGPNLLVRLTAQGVEIVPAGELVPGTGHHHLYLDADLTDGSVPVPTVPGQIIHLGTGVSEYTFENVAPGEHRLIAVVADGLHIPLQPWVVDTVTFTVR